MTMVGPNQPADTIGAPPEKNSPGAPAGLIDPISGPMGVLEYDLNEGMNNVSYSESQTRRHRRLTSKSRAT
jgi:hypothetical protein